MLLPGIWCTYEFLEECLFPPRVIIWFKWEKSIFSWDFTRLIAFSILTVFSLIMLSPRDSIFESSKVWLWNFRLLSRFDPCILSCLCLTVILNGVSGSLLGLWHSDFLCIGLFTCTFRWPFSLRFLKQYSFVRLKYFYWRL